MTEIWESSSGARSARSARSVIPYLLFLLYHSSPFYWSHWFLFGRESEIKIVTSLLVITFQLIQFLKNKEVIIQLWGKQVVDKKPVNKTAKKGKDTKAIMRAETLKKNVSTNSILP